jgi:hypothetical protein
MLPVMGFQDVAYSRSGAGMKAAETQSEKLLYVI